MRKCAACFKKIGTGDGSMFAVPRDEDSRKKWGEICGKELKRSAQLCSDHFLTSSIVQVGKVACLIPNAEPIFKPQKEVEYVPWVEFSTGDETSVAKEYINPATTKDASQNNVLREQKRVFKQNSTPHNNIIPPQLQEEPIMHVPQEESMMQITVIKSVSCAETTQTNTRLCGLVETSDFADEFRFNCFYCSEVFLLEKFKTFINHLKVEHFEMEEAFKTSKYISEDHDYTPINLTPSAPPETSLETVVYNAKSFLVDPLEPSHNPIGSMDLNSIYCPEDDNKTFSNRKQLLTKTNKPLSTMPVSMMRNKLSRRKRKLKYSFLRNSQGVLNKNKSFKSKLISSDRFHLRGSTQQPSKVTPLSRCLKRTNEIEVEEEEEEEESIGVDVMEEYEPNNIENVNQKPTEITFGYTPRDIVNTLLENMKKYPVLWQYDDEPFNQDYFEAVEDLCKIVNYKWSLNIDNLKMRRSINRILRYYCYLYPNSNVENVDEFTFYYDKCDTFLPSAHEIAYARCSHCYTCFKNDFDLKLHLGVEHRYLQWPYKCPQCYECFRECDEFEFHKLLPHYDEVFRCLPCNKSFFRLHSYKRHNLEAHSNRNNKIGEFKCDLCDRVLQTMNGLRHHKKTHGDKQYNCNQCSKSFFENSKLKIHIKTHQKQYDFMCEICGKEFILQSGLRTHMKKHTGEKVTCNICNLRLRKSSLSRHMRTVHVVHEGIVETTIKGKHLYYRRLIKPLRRMQRKRGEQRQYRCKICKIGFDNYKLIVEHNKEFHFDMQKWPCKICGRQFGQKINLKGHYRRKHKLHVYQVFKLVEENSDVDEVLAIKTEHIDKLFGALTCSKNNTDNVNKSNVTTTIKSDDLLDETCFEDEEEIYSSTIEDEIMEGVDNIDDIFTDF